MVQGLNREKGKKRVQTTEGLKAAAQAKIRDYNTCVLCSTKGVEAHHIDNNWENNDLHNLITLCKTCHMAVGSARTKSMLKRAMVLVKHLRDNSHPDAIMQLETLSGWGIRSHVDITSQEEFDYAIEAWITLEDYLEVRKSPEDLYEDMPAGAEFKFIRFNEEPECPMKTREIVIDSKGKIQPCNEYDGSGNCSCIGFNETHCPLHDCEKFWCDRLTLSEHGVIDSKFEEPLVILRGSVVSGSLDKTKDPIQSGLEDYID